MNKDPVMNTDHTVIKIVSITILINVIEKQLGYYDRGLISMEVGD